MPADLGLCLACSTNKAVTKEGTLPLCAKCAKEARKNARGVTVSKPKKDKKALSA